MSIDRLNRDCQCISVDRQELERQVAHGMQASGLAPEAFALSPQLFASVPVFMARQHVERMRQVVAAIERAVATPAWQALALGEAAETARHPMAARGVFFGYDFHLGHDGPQLIEINTNAGGALLNVLLARAQRACCKEALASLAVGPYDLSALESVFVDMFREEWRLFQGAASAARPLRRIAIVDEEPTSQFLYVEFLLFRELFRRNGLEAVVCGPGELRYEGGALLHESGPVDLVYNRLTDFYLEAPQHAALRDAYLADAALLTPHPRAHALYARKSHLVRLADPAFLRELGLDEATRETLRAGVPPAIFVDPNDGERLWRERKSYFFKPIAGYGSKAAYRGDKLTKGTFAEILSRDYIAQRTVPPSERHIEIDGATVPLKMDVRNYTYAGQVQLLASRLYHGQTTNFRTAGGGFAPVFTEA